MVHIFMHCLSTWLYLYSGQSAIEHNEFVQKWSSDLNNYLCKFPDNTWCRSTVSNLQTVVSLADEKAIVSVMQSYKNIFSLSCICYVKMLSFHMIYFQFSLSPCHVNTVLFHPVLSSFSLIRNFLIVHWPIKIYALLA